MGLRSQAPAARPDGGRDWEESSVVLNVQSLERTWFSGALQVGRVASSGADASFTQLMI